MNRNTSAYKLALAFVSAMSAEDIKEIRHNGAGTWGDTVRSLQWDHETDGERPDTDEVLRAMEVIIGEMSARRQAVDAIRQTLGRRRPGPRTAHEIHGGHLTSVRLPIDLVETLDGLAAARGMSRSQIIIDLLYEYLQFQTDPAILTGPG